VYESTVEVEAQYGHTILDGPFRGMKYPIGALLNRHGNPILFGTYELDCIRSSTKLCRSITTRSSTSDVPRATMPLGWPSGLMSRCMRLIVNRGSSLHIMLG